MPRKLTPWFDGGVCPVRHGFYDVRIRLQITGTFSLPQRVRYDGEWHFFPTGKPFGQVDGDQWRGLAAPPSSIASAETGGENHG